MASTSSQGVSTPDEGEDDLIRQAILLCWGQNPKEDVFGRWTQGFLFSEDEPTALIQNEGGPCAIIAPVQAYLLKNLLFGSGEIVRNWRDVQGNKIKELLLATLAQVLEMVSPASDSYKVVVKGEKQQPVIEACEATAAQLDSQSFHSNLRFRCCSSAEEAYAVLETYYESLIDSHGILLFLYSVLLTKGLDLLASERGLGDDTEPLIDGIHGYGSQSLINLMITGTAASNVWDNEKEVSGLKLRGITGRCNVGFLTLLEYLRYCEVGWYLKNPHFPIWVIGSETHLTVLFTQEMSLVASENEWAKARRIFNGYDVEGSGFVSSCLLGDVLRALELVAEPEYVEIMKNKLDPDEFGIILLSVFMEEFVPNEPQSPYPENFPLFHYNGLKRSSPTGKVNYIEGKCTIYDQGNIQTIGDETPIKTCLATKWPAVELHWLNGLNPPIN